jgi:hypothetical protein
MDRPTIKANRPRRRKRVRGYLGARIDSLLTMKEVRVASIESRSFDEPDEKKTPDKTTIELVGLAGGQIQRTTFQPGFRWSESIGPLMGADRCQVDHIGYVASGQLHIEHDDGTTGAAKAGEVFRIAPGHDAWVVGDEPVVLIEFQGATHVAGS